MPHTDIHARLLRSIGCNVPYRPVLYGRYIECHGQQRRQHNGSQQGYGKPLESFLHLERENVDILTCKNKHFSGNPSHSRPFFVVSPVFSWSMTCGPPPLRPRDPLPCCKRRGPNFFCIRKILFSSPCTATLGNNLCIHTLTLRYKDIFLKHLLFTTDLSRKLRFLTKILGVLEKEKSTVFILRVFRILKINLFTVKKQRSYCKKKNLSLSSLNSVTFR